MKFLFYWLLVQETSESCYDTIRQSWSEIDRVAAEKGGLQKLNILFSSCRL